MLSSLELKASIRKFWNPDGVFRDGTPAYVKTFKTSAASEACIEELISAGILEDTPCEEEAVDNRFVAIRLSKEHLDLNP